MICRVCQSDVAAGEGREDHDPGTKELVAVHHRCRPAKKAVTPVVWHRTLWIPLWLARYRRAIRTEEILEYIRWICGPTMDPPAGWESCIESKWNEIASLWIPDGRCA